MTTPTSENYTLDPEMASRVKLVSRVEVGNISRDEDAEGLRGKELKKLSGRSLESVTDFISGIFTEISHLAGVRGFSPR
jgi:hypothetical protein